MPKRKSKKKENSDQPKKKRKRARSEAIQQKDLEQYVHDCCILSRMEVMKKHTNTFARYRNLYSDVRDVLREAKIQERVVPKKPIVIAIIGPSGAGKGLLAQLIADYVGGEMYEWKGGDLWRNYDGEDIIIFNKMDKKLTRKNEATVRSLCDHTRKKFVDIPYGRLELKAKLWFWTAEKKEWLLENQGMKRRCNAIFDIKEKSGFEGCWTKEKVSPDS